LFGEFASESKVHVQLLQGGVITATTGTEVNVFNHNHNSSNVSTILQNKSGAYVAGMKVLKDATVSAGTIKAEDYEFVSKKEGAKGRASAEFDLAVNTVYEILLTSDDGSKGLHLEINWYEIDA